jgi:hypothetical protein
MSWGPLLVNLAVTAGLVAVLMLATFLYAMRTGCTRSWTRSGRWGSC